MYYELSFVDEIQDTNEVKIALCFVLSKSERLLTEKQLYRVVFESDSVNWFLYAEGLKQLLDHGTISLQENPKGDPYVILEEKGKQAAKELKESVSPRFRKRLLWALYFVWGEIASEESVKTNIKPAGDGTYYTEAVVTDGVLDLCKMSFYAPDYEQSLMLEEKIKADPITFYKKVLDYLLHGKRDEIKITDENI
jgi:hypothetical protein